MFLLYQFWVLGLNLALAAGFTDLQVWVVHVTRPSIRVVLKIGV